MGGTQSVEGFDGDPFGYRIIDVQPNSPGADAGLVSWFDFVVEAGGQRLDVQDSSFINMIVGSEGKPLPLKVYNAKCARLREVTLVPSKGWGGKGLLGVTIRFDTFADAADQVLHVIDVAPRSPAAAAGLLPQEDYLLGTAATPFATAEDLTDEVTGAMGSELAIYVYNSQSDVVRCVSLVPRGDWGGEGVLGCNVGQGYLHRLPTGCRSSPGRPLLIAGSAAPGAGPAAPAPVAVPEAPAKAPSVPAPAQAQAQAPESADDGEGSEARVRAEPAPRAAAGDPTNPYSQ